MTANALEGDRERCLKAGMDGYLSKPFTMEELRDVLTSHMSDGLVAEARKDSIQTLPTLSDAENSSYKNHTILVVEDNLVNQEVARAMLKSLGYEARVAGDGNEALDAMSLESFELILMDCHMPGLDGYDTTEEIRRQEASSTSARRIPIVALTADALESNRELCADCGMDDYVSKPFTQEQLKRVLTRWLSDAGSTSRIKGHGNFSKNSALASTDHQALDEIRNLDPSGGDDFLRDIVLSFCASSTKLMLKLRSAVAEHDSDAIRHIAHSLKGASAQIGAKLLASLCESLVSSGKNDDFDNARILFEQAAIEHAAVINALDEVNQSAVA